MRRSCLVVLLLVLLAPCAYGARFDTSFEFSTIDTPHFSVHFHQGLEEVARRAATIAEEIHGRLAAEFLWEPAEKTQLVLADDSDFANGATTVIPYNAILLQIVPPSFDSTIGEYDDWLRELILHEYAHVLTIDPARGYSRLTRSVFGKPLPGGDPFSFLMFLGTAPPNVFLPRWWHEGMATWSETEYGSAGRGRSTLYETILRMAVAEKNLPTIDLLNGDVPYWPNGHLPYIFGLRLQKYITDTYGRDALGRLAKEHAGYFPYFINFPPWELFNGNEYPELYQGMLAELKREQGERISILNRRPFTPLRLVAEDGENLTAPRYSPDGSLIAYNRHDPHGHAEVVVTDPDGKNVKARVRRLTADDGISWSPDGTGLYFSQAEIFRGFDFYEDIFFYDLGRDRLERLTRGLRAREPELSPDRTTFALVVTDRGSQNLALLDAAKARQGQGRDALRVVSDYRMSRVANPRWSPDGGQIAYARTDERGKSGIYLYEVATDRHRPLVTGNYNAAYPVWSRDGTTLFYVADETGVFNLFAISSAGGESSQVSHLLGGAVQPDISPDGATLLFSSYTSRGFKIAAMAAERSGWLAGRSPAITPYWRETNKGAQTHASLPPPPAPPPEARPYRPWATLLPRFWLPTLASDGKNNTIGGAFTAGQDALGYHSYLADAAYGGRFRKLYYSVAYRNDSFYPTLLLQTYNQEVLYSDLLQRGDYFEENRGVIAQLSVPLNFVESRYRFFGGYQLQDQRALSPAPSGLFNGLPVFQGRRDNLFAGVEFDDTLKYPYSISREEGRTISLVYRRFDRELGSDLDGAEYTASYQEYLPLRLAGLRHHVIRYSLAGGVSTGERTVQQAFQIGGTPSLFNRFPLRGYPSRFETGKYVATGSLEYRAPVWNFLRGFGTKPLFLEKLHGALFADTGEVWDDGRSFRADRLKTGAGVEARLDLTLGYWLKITPALGYAHGFNRGGEEQVYLTIYADL
jgi:Tol biopolymer transport system component